MNTDKLALIAVALVIAATAVGIYTENKKPKPPGTGPDEYRRGGRPLAN